MATSNCSNWLHFALRACAQQWHRHTRCKMLHIDLKVHRKYHKVTRTKRFGSVPKMKRTFRTAIALDLYKCGSRYRIILHSVDVVRFDIGERRRAKMRKHAGRAVCTFQLSSTSQITAGRSAHICAPLSACNTNDEQHTIRANDIIVAMSFVPFASPQDIL